MENKPKLSHHEAMELHELMNNYIVGIKHINTEMSKVDDEELKSFMEDSLNNKVTKLQEINEFFNSGNQQTEDSNENQDQDSSQDQYSSQSQDSSQSQSQDSNQYQYQYQSSQNQSSQFGSSKS
jgi:hypothetical protein